MWACPRCKSLNSRHELLCQVKVDEPLSGTEHVGTEPGGWVLPNWTHELLSLLLEVPDSARKISMHLSSLAPPPVSGSPNRAVANDGNWPTRGGQVIGSVKSAATTTSSAKPTATGHSARPTGGLARSAGTTTTKGGSSATEARVVHLGLGASVRMHIGWTEFVQRPECL